MPLTTLAIERNHIVVAEQARIAALDAEHVPAAIDGGEDGGANDCVQSRRVAAAGGNCNAHQGGKENALTRK